MQVSAPSSSVVRFSAVVLLSCFAGLPANAAYQVLVAGPPGTPGIDFSSIEAAIGAAEDGDTVLLKDFLEGDAIIDGKAITIGEYPGSHVELTRLTVRNVPVGKTLVVQDLGLNILGASNQIRDCAGSIVLQRIEIAAQSVGSVANPEPALTIENCASVSVLRCTVVGRSTSGIVMPGASAGVGLRTRTSTVHLFEGSFRGGDGGSLESFYPSFVAPPVAGACAIELQGGRIEVIHSTVNGGAGGAGGEVFQGGPCFPNQAGAPGIRVEGTALVLGSTISGGKAGDAAVVCGSAGGDAPGIALISGSVTEQPRELRSVEVSSISNVGGDVYLLLRGVPGEPVFLMKSPVLAATWNTGLNGLLFPASPFVIVPLGTVPAVGFAQYAFTIPHGVLPIGIDAVGEFLQYVTVDSSSKPFLSSPCAFTVLR